LGLKTFLITSFFGVFHMAKTYELTVEARSDLGKGASRRLRRLADLVPGVMYGGDEPALALSVDHNQLSKALENEAFYSHILTINIGDKKQKAVLKDLQRHPSRPRILHLDLQRITGKEKIHMRIPLHFIGGEEAPGVVDEGGVISHIINDVEIRCLPADLPEFLEVPLAHLKLDDSVHLSDLKLPKGVELVALMHGHDNDMPVASLHIPRIIEEEVIEPVSAEVPTIGEEEAAAEASAAPATTAAPAEKDKGKKDK
jgi:large subunit ribosomal protein L25